MLLLRPVSATEARANWEWVRRGLLTVLERTRDDWTPEDIYVSIAGGAAQLFHMEHDGAAVGFTIMRRIEDPSGIVLFVWVMYAAPGAIGQNTGAWLAAVDAVARDMGAGRVRMASPRKGWRRYFKATQIIYEREL